MMSLILVGSAMRATPPWARISAGTRSRAMTAVAPASSAILACSAVVTSMITPPFSISAKPVLSVNAVSVISNASPPQSSASSVAGLYTGSTDVLGRRHWPAMRFAIMDYPPEVPTIGQRQHVWQLARPESLSFTFDMVADRSQMAYNSLSMRFVAHLQYQLDSYLVDWGEPDSTAMKD